MSRLDGQKKSSLPLIIGLLAGFAAGVGGYTFYAQNIGPDATAPTTLDNTTNSSNSSQENQPYNRPVAPGDASVKSDSDITPTNR